ncbi:DUF1269 domain-containing protein [Epidermidibacterium keratini]|uniref:DUF1269 domain-containing protein n=1 Tax=Epidermidibacterium keratini TaxID=1891644 RepID=UPI0018659E6F|nr:DUF1269 domain-containing protein [Epidermidibacterium keratini]
MADDTKYAVLITFPDNAKTFEAMTKLGDAGSDVVAAAVVERGKDGRLTVEDHADSRFAAGTAGGSLIGMVIGVLGGPLGVLLGWGVGAAAGSLVDAARAGDQDAALAELSRQVPPGHNAIVAETDEPSTAALDEYVASMGGTVTRRPLEEVVSELEAQDAAAEAAADAAAEELRKQKREERKEKLHDRIEALKAKFA